MPTAKFQVKKLKTFDCGLHWVVSLYYRGKQVATIYNEDYERPKKWEWLNKEIKSIFSEYVKTEGVSLIKHSRLPTFSSMTPLEQEDRVIADMVTEKIMKPLLEEAERTQSRK